ncbi:MAG: DHA2 family efflux MFS transporter permease subunit [Rhodospirillaceae bacterium]|nr:DHA2 family efflux MFS transporter permease subunit [Rhodospirillaceae bacterium]
MPTEDSRQLRFERRIVTTTVMATTFMAILDSTIVNIALPQMQGSLSATQDQITWVLTGYIVALAVATPLGGALSARLGRKRVIALAVLGFTLASVMCGAASSLSQIVLFRVLQGFFGAALVPLSQAILLDLYPREKHGFAMAVWGVGVVFAPVLGPTLGGILTEFYNWRWIFYINVPVGVAALCGILAYVRETDRRNSQDFDYFGFIFLGVAIGAFQLMLDRGESLDWFASTEIVVEATLAGLSFYMFLVHTITTRHPFIPLAMFRDRNFVASVVTIFMISTIHLGALALLPPFLQQLLDYPVLTAGYVLAPRGLGTMTGIILATRLATKLDMRLLVFCGLVLNIVALWELSHFSLEVPTDLIVRTGLIQGLGLGFIFVPMTTLAFATLPSSLRDEATAMFNLLRNLGSSVGISIWITLLVRNTTTNHAALAEHLSPFRDALQHPLLPGAWEWRLPSGVLALNAEVTRQAGALAYVGDFQLMMWVTVICALPVLLLRKSP